MTKGLTIIEMILVVALIAVLGASTTPFLTRFVQQAQFDRIDNAVIGSLIKAQDYAISRKNNSVWGVCQTSEKIRFYRGSCTSPVSSEDWPIPSSVVVSNLSDTTFNQRGEPSGALAITVDSTIESSTINLNTAGGLTIN